MTGRPKRHPTGDIRGAPPSAQGTASRVHSRTEAPPRAAARDRRRRRVLRHKALSTTRPAGVRPPQRAAPDPVPEISLDESESRIPAERRKLCEAHLVPLSRSAVVVTPELAPSTKHIASSAADASNFVFPSARSASPAASGRSNPHGRQRMMKDDKDGDRRQIRGPPRAFPASTDGCATGVSPTTGNCAVRMPGTGGGAIPPIVGCQTRDPSQTVRRIDFVGNVYRADRAHDGQRRGAIDHVRLEIVASPAPQRVRSPVSICRTRPASSALRPQTPCVSNAPRPLSPSLFPFI